MCLGMGWATTGPARETAEAPTVARGEQPSTAQCMSSSSSPWLPLSRAKEQRQTAVRKGHPEGPSGRAFTR